VTNGTPIRITGGGAQQHGLREISRNRDAVTSPVQPSFFAHGPASAPTRADHAGPGAASAESVIEGRLPLMQAASAAIARAELAAAGACIGIVFALLVLNIVTRTAGHALFWVDEAAVAAMVWMAFFASSVTLHKRGNIAVTFAVDLFPPLARRALAVVVDLVLLGFVLVLAVLVWRWFAPHQLIAAGGDPAAFSAATMNFIYEEPTSLGVRKAWIWLVMPLFVLCSLVHCIANLDRSLSLFARGERR